MICHINYAPKYARVEKIELQRQRGRDIRGGGFQLDLKWSGFLPRMFFACHLQPFSAGSDICLYFSASL